MKLRDELRQVDQSSGAGTAIVELDQSRLERLSRITGARRARLAPVAALLRPLLTITYGILGLEFPRRRQVQLQQIASAPQTLERDEFGWCREWGDEINLSRLRFDPTTRYCIDFTSEKGK